MNASSLLNILGGVSIYVSIAAAIGLLIAWIAGSFDGVLAALGLGAIWAVGRALSTFVGGEE